MRNSDGYSQKLLWFNQKLAKIVRNSNHIAVFKALYDLGLFHSFLFSQIGVKALWIEFVEIRIKLGVTVGFVQRY